MGTNHPAYHETFESVKARARDRAAAATGAELESQAA